MTYLISYLLIPVLAMLLALPKEMQAQSDERSVSITATTVVMGDIELETIRDVVFQQDAITDSMIYIDPAHNFEAGKLKAYGAAGAAFRVTFLKDLRLRNASTDDSVQISYEVTGFPDDEQQASEPLDALEHELKFNEEGEFYFWIGGTVQIDEIPDGNYNGKFTLEMEYN